MEVVSKRDTTQLDPRDGERPRGLVVFWCLVHNWVSESRRSDRRAAARRAVKMNVLVWVDALLLY